MDLSKLPKLSQTPPPPPPAPESPQFQSQPHAPPLDYSARPPAPIAAEIWISLVLGLIFMMLGGTFGRYAIDKITHQPFHTGVEWTPDSGHTGEVEYFDLQGFTALTDMSIFLFGLAMVFDGIALAVTHSRPSIQRRILMLAFLVTITATSVNLYAILKMLSAGLTPILSLLAVAFGVYIAMFQWNSLKVLQAVKRRSNTAF